MMPRSSVSRQNYPASPARACNFFGGFDPAILGGAIIKVGEQIIDGSLRRKLDQIKERLAQ